MTANELRLGNWVLNPDEEEEIIIDNVSMELAMYHPDVFEPIPLTEEWLLKFGFNNDGWLRVKDFNLFSLGFAEDMDCYFHDGIDWVDFKYKDKHNIKYVHQLQNLYFALTGKELEIKELATNK